MMKICFLIPSLGDGGAQRQCIALLNTLQVDAEVELHLILLGAGLHDSSLDTSRLNVHRTQVRNFASPFALAFVVRTLRQVRPDLLLSWLHPADIWAYAATRLVRGLPWAITERGSAYPSTMVFNLRKKLGRRAALVIPNSIAGERLWLSLRPSGEVRVIPNMTIQPSVAVPALDRSDAADCLCVGRLELEKNFAAATSAFAAFATTRTDARLTFAGEGSQAAEILRIAEAHGIAGRVRMLGFRRDVPLLMARSRVFVSLSHHEGMPNGLMEAIAADLPAIVSDIPEHRALLGDNYPYYVRVGSSDMETATVIAEAWDGSNSSRDIYGYANAVLETMRPEHIARQYIRAFEDTIGRARATESSPSPG